MSSRVGAGVAPRATNDCCRKLRADSVNDPNSLVGLARLEALRKPTIVSRMPSELWYVLVVVAVVGGWQTREKWKRDAEFSKVIDQ